MSREESALMPLPEENSQGHSERRKILWVYPFILGETLHKTEVLEILTSLVERGNNVCLITMRSRKGFNYDETSKIHMISIPMKYLPLVSPIMFAILSIFILPVYIISFKPNVIVSRLDISTLSFIPSLPLIKFKKTKLIFDVRSTPVETGGFRGFLQTFWFTPLILLAKKFFDGLTIITPLMKKSISESYQIDPTTIGVWTSGVSHTLFNPKIYRSAVVELKRKLGLSRNFVVFYHGVFTANRGLIETIHAIKILQKKIPDLTLFLLGTGPIIPAMKDKIQREQLQDRVIIHNPVNHREVPKYIAMSDACIIPLQNHPFWRFQCPLKLLEYLAMEKVVIATDIPAHRLIIGEEKCGIYTPSAEPIEIAKSIMHAYNNKGNLEEWGKSGRSIVTEKYTWEKVAKDLESYLLSIDN